MISNHYVAQFENDLTHWEKVARTRWGAYTTEIARQTILRGHDLSGKPTTALEIGCEGGRWIKLLTELGWKMTCTEINHEVLKICKTRIPDVNCILVHRDDDKIPCDTESVDLLLCIEVAPVIQSEWFINEAFRVLKNQGLMVGVFWNLLSLRGLFSHIIATHTGNFDYYKITYRPWKRKLSIRGFSIIHEEGYCWFPFNRTSNSICVPFFTYLEKSLKLRKLPTISPWIAFIAQKKSENS